MASPHFADPANLIVEEQPTIPDNIPLPQVADEVVRGKRTLSRDQMRLLIELLPYHLPKLSATAHVNFSFAAELEKALERAKLRSAQANLRLINGPNVSDASKPH